MFSENPSSSSTDMPADNFDDLKPDSGAPKSRKKPFAPIDPVEQLEGRVALLEKVVTDQTLLIRDLVADKLEQLDEQMSFHVQKLNRSVKDESKERRNSIAELTRAVTNALVRLDEGNASSSTREPSIETISDAIDETQNQIDALRERLSVEDDAELSS